MNIYCKGIICCVLLLADVMSTTGSAVIDCQAVNDKPDDVPMRYCARYLIKAQECLCQAESSATNVKKSWLNVLHKS